MLAMSLSAVNAEARPAPSPCGNGLIENGEECDDGNRVDGDGCSAACIIERPDAEVIDSGEADAAELKDGSTPEEDAGPVEDGGIIGGNDASMGGGDAMNPLPDAAVPADSGSPNRDASTGPDTGLSRTDSGVVASDGGSSGTGEDDEDSCGCRATRGGAAHSGLLLMLFAALGLGLSRGRPRS